MQADASGGPSATALGASPTASRASIAVKVVHGHLAFAKHPVLVGHYNGDTFAGAEAQLDRVLENRLTQRRHLGLYPGPLGTSTVVLDALQKPPGAVVVGLGEAANLSLGGLRRTIRQGILALAAAEADHRRTNREKIGAPGRTARMHFSALLVGSGDGGLDQTTCVTALLQATAEAQSAIEQAADLTATLESLEIIEILESRAHAIWRSVNGAIAAQANLAELFVCEREIQRRSGARRWIATVRDRSWWEPIQITMPKGEEGQRSLAFAISGGRARAELRTIAADLDIVEPLMRRAVKAEGPEGATASPGRALFEILWPASLKDQSVEERNRRLILDEESAQFPWELLDDRRPWDVAGELKNTKRDPPAVRYGLVRQLLQTRFQERVVVPTGKPKALVVGDPSGAQALGFLPLEEARKEAVAIAELLSATHDVTLKVEAEATPENICEQLFAEAWEIVHIAAHGVVRKQMVGRDGVQRPMTGVVLGGGVVLGPSVLSKIPIAPNLFFLNCCHIGRVDPGAEDEARKAALAVNHPELAAGVAVQLIRSGVRAVVAAGWAVDDDAALAFSRRFYEIMLDGGGFGEAALAARREAYRKRPAGTTWGAYQCYGEPDYVLPRVERQTDRGQNGNGAGDVEPFVACAEAIAAVVQIREDLNIGLERDLARQRALLAEIENDAGRRNWLGTGELRVALAEARAELGDLPAAIAHYEAARTGVDSRFNVKAIEQLVNLRARHAAISFRNAPADRRNPEATVREIEAARALMERLVAVVGASRERLAITGGCWKRLAQVQATSDRADAALAEMARCYEQAIASAAEVTAGSVPSIHRSYPILMHLSARVISALRAGKPTKTLLTELVALQNDIDGSDSDDFWILIAATDVRMMIAIASGSFGEDDEAAARQSYLKAWKHVGSPVKMMSVIEQLDFYEDVLGFGRAASEPSRLRLVTFIRSIGDELRKVAT